MGCVPPHFHPHPGFDEGGGQLSPLRDRRISDRIPRPLVTQNRPAARGTLPSGVAIGVANRYRL